MFYRDGSIQLCKTVLNERNYIELFYIQYPSIDSHLNYTRTADKAKDVKKYIL